MAGTDASWKHRAAGLGYVLTDGRWGLRNRPAWRRDTAGQQPTVVNELRAVGSLPSTLDRATDAPLTVLVDSQEALEFLYLWHSDTDLTVMPRGYDLRPRIDDAQPSLVALAHRVAHRPGLALVHVKGHRGHCLNETTDALARMARRNLHERFNVAGRAKALVESFLHDWHTADSTIATAAAMPPGRTGRTAAVRHLGRPPPRSVRREGGAARGSWPVRTRRWALPASMTVSERRTVRWPGDIQYTPKGGDLMDLREYQRHADETSQLRRGGPQAAVTPMLGLAGETGSILDIYKKYLRDGTDLAANRELLREELGDLLWYAAAVATACGLDLAEIAEANLRRTRDLYATPAERERLAELPMLDAGYPAHERFPRRLVIEFTERQDRGGRIIADLTLIAAEPNAFPVGPRTERGRTVGFQVGGRLGDPLTDNSRHADAYRFHDAIHLGFLAVLGWSPNLRSLLRLKRKSDPATDECEDGARAIFAEEGLAAVLSRLAKRRVGFLTETAVTGEVIEVARAAAVDLEVDTLPGWLWRRAICHGFRALHQLAANTGGYLVADLDAHALAYTKYLAGHRFPADLAEAA